MKSEPTGCRIAGLVLLGILCGCHDWTTPADAAGDATDAPDGEGSVDGPVDTPPDTPPDDATEADVVDDAADDAAGPDDTLEAETAPDGPADDGDVGDDGGLEALPVCGNGVVEPGEDCERERTVECTTSCGTHRTVACPDDCLVPPPAECPATDEVCNGIDDDCSGVPDDPAWTVCPGCTVRERSGHVYHFCADLEWAAASAACRDRGMYLSTIDDAAENDWLVSTLTTLGTGPWWCGFNDRAVEGVWVWDGPTPVVPFAAWGTGEPNDYGTGEDCAELLFSASGWNDSNCAVGQPYVCEYP